MGEGKMTIMPNAFRGQGLTVNRPQLTYSSALWESWGGVCRESDPQNKGLRQSSPVRGEWEGCAPWIWGNSVLSLRGGQRGMPVPHGESLAQPSTYFRLLQARTRNQEKTAAWPVSKGQPWHVVDLLDWEQPRAGTHGRGECRSQERTGSR